MKKIAFALLTIFSLFVLSCEIGLGASVDTDAPSLEILNPPVDSVIRDTFALSGTWADDGNIASVNVALKRTDISGETKNIAGTLAGDIRLGGSGTWTAEIVPVAEDGTKLISDGSYQATVTIKDTVGRTTIRNTTFTIDNTPPVIVLTRPSTAADSLSSDTYGQTFNLEGQAADTNNVSLIEVMIYSDAECTNHIHTVPLKNVPNSINMDVAKFVKGDTENDYFKIYGESTTEGGPKQFYCKLVAYDGAQCYPADGSAQTEADQKGNGIDTYYLYKDIATTILQNYKITEVYSMLNGTYTASGTARSVSVEDVMTLLNKSKKSQGKFTLNPKNNPTFQVTGKNPLLLDGHDFEGGKNDVTANGQVVIEVSPGLDGILLDEDSLAVYAIECNASGVVLPGAEKIYPTTTKQESGTSYKFITTISRDKGFVIGRNYILGVDGHDQAEFPNSIEPVGLAYGFHMSSSGKAPNLTITNPTTSNAYLNEEKANAFVFEGNVALELGVPTIRVYKDKVSDTDEPIDTITFSQVASSTTGGELNYPFTWHYSNYTDKSTVKFTFEAVYDGITSQPIEKTVVYDFTVPTITILKVTPNLEDVKKYDSSTEDGNTIDGSYLNGIPEFTLAIVDDYDQIASASYQIEIDGTKQPVQTITNPARQVISIDTTPYNNSTLKFEIVAEDRAGNKHTEINTYTIDKETDKPVILPGEPSTITFKLADQDAYNAQTGTKKGIATVGTSLLMNLHDDDGLHSLIIKNSDANLLNWNGTTWVDLTRPKNDQTITPTTSNEEHILSGTDKSFSYPLPSDGGLYKFYYKLTDKYGTYVEGTFVLNLTKAAAEISSIKAKDGKDAANENGSITTVISIIESQQNYKLICSINEGAESPIAENLQSTDFPYEHTINASDLTVGSNTISYKILDGNDRGSAWKDITLIRDDTLPIVKLNSLPGITDITTFTSYTFQGTVSDAGLSGVDKVVLSISGTTVAGGTKEYEIVPNGENWVQVVNWDEIFKQSNGTHLYGEKTVTVTAYDKAGNASSDFALGTETGKTSVSFIYDKEKPTLTITTPYTNVTNNKYIQSGAKISGTATDNLALATSNALIVTELLEGEETTASGQAVIIGADGSWSVNIPLNSSTANGNYTYRFTLKDKAGNERGSNDIKLILDTLAPTVSLKALPGRTDTKNKGFTFTGSADDATSGVKEINFTIKDSTDTSKTHTVTFDTTSSWSYTLECEADAWKNVFTSEGKKTIYISVTDDAGLTSEYFTYEKDTSVIQHKEFIYDTADPKLENITGFQEFMPSTGLTISGKASDTNKLASLRVIEKINGSETAESLSDDPAKNTIVVSGTLTNWTKHLPLGEIPSANEEYEYTYSFVLKDEVGNTVYSTEYTTTLDKMSPDISITKPVSDTGDNAKKGKNAIDETSFKFEGKVENETNLSAVYYVIDTNSGAPAKPTANVINASSWLALNFEQANIGTTLEGTTNWNFYQSFKAKTSTETDKLPESLNYYLHIYAVDKAGNVSSVTTRNFDVDLSDPVSTATVSKKIFNINDLTSNAGSFTLNGVTSDTLGLASAVITATHTKDSTKSKTITKTVNGTWTQDFIFGLAANSSAENYLAEGQYEITVKATDTAGKEKTSDKITITVDYTPPELQENTIKLNDEEYSADNWNEARSLKLDIGLKDTVSEITTVKCMTYKNGTLIKTVPLSDNGTTDDGIVLYTGTAQFNSDGSDLSFKISATDAAGNEFTTATAKTVKIDTSAPSLELYKYKIGTESEEGTLKSVSGTVFVNNNVTLTVYGNYSDIQSGVKALVFDGTEGDAQPEVTYSTAVASDNNDSYDSYANILDKAAIRSWKAVFTKDKLKTATLTVTGLNNAGTEGLSVDKNLFAISRDTTDPTFNNLSFTTDSEHFSVYPKKAKITETVNGVPKEVEYVEKYYIHNSSDSFSISGLAEDAIGSEGPASGVEKVVLTIPGAKGPNNTTSPFTSVSGALFTDIDLSGCPGDSVTATLKVYDYAGNSFEYTLPEIIFDNDRPVGIHEIDSTGKDLIFRIGDYTNDDITKNNATSDYNLEWNEYTNPTTSKKYTKIDEAAGGKYSGGTFGKSYTQKVRGSFSDANGSGIKQIYYKIYDRSQSLIWDATKNEEWYYTEDDLNDAAKREALEERKKQLVEDVVSANQYIAPYSTPEYKRVFYNVEVGTTDPYNGHQLQKDSVPVIERKKLNTDGAWITIKDNTDPDWENATKFYKYWKIEEATYSFTIPQLNEGSNYLVVVAEDNVGNFYIDCSDPIDHDGDGNEATPTPKRIYSNYSMNVDTTVPVIGFNDPENTEIKYKKDNFIVKVTVTDPGVANTPNSSSGIKSVVLSGNNNEVKCRKSTVTGEENVWQADVSSLLTENKSVTITATATDVAGNSTPMVVANIFKDTRIPTVSIDKPANADKLAAANADIKVNGTISLSGISQDVAGGSGLKEDTSGSKTLKLYYTTNSTLGQKTATDISSSDIKADDDTISTAADKFIFLDKTENTSPWEFTGIDTTVLTGTVYFMVSTQDKAGGTGYSAPQKVIVDQDTNRPIIKMNQVTSANAATDYLQSKTVFGSVIDDDGDVKNLWAWSKKKNGDAEPENPPTYENNTWNLGKTDTTQGWVQFGSENSKSTLENNNWQIEATDPDGENIWYWAVQDANGTIFWTKGETSPYILYKEETEKKTNATGISFKYDTESPDITSVELIRLPTNIYKTGITYYTAAEIQEEYMDVQTTPLTWSSHDNIVFGKDLGLMYLKVTLTEKTGMSASPLVIKQTQTDTVYLSVTDKISSSNSGNTYTYIVGPFDLSTKTTAEVTLRIIATDLAGKTGSKEKSIIVDNDADITISKVTPKPNAEQSGEFTFQGSVVDGHSSISEIKYYVPPYATYNSWKTAANDAAKENILKSISDTETDSKWVTISDPGISFRIDFGGTNNFSDIIGYTTSGANASVSADFANYDTGLLAGEQDETGIYSVPIWFKVKDEVGNIKYITSATDTDTTTNSTVISDLKVKYNPNTDRPSVTIIDPDITAEGIEKGGKFKISGTASDDEGIAEVWLQFDLGSGSFDNGSLSAVDDISYTGTPAYRGIKANGTKNWSYTLDASSLASYTTTNKLVRVRAIAIDSDTQEPRVSAWSEVLKIKINNDIPYIENLYVRKREGNSPSGAVKVSRDYTSEMFIPESGWFLEGIAYTSSSDKLTSLEAGDYSWTGNGTTLTAASGNPSSPAAYAAYVTENSTVNPKQIEFRIPITGNSKWEVSPIVTDNNSPAKSNSSVKYTVNVDDTKPSFPDIEGNVIRLYRDSYGISSNLLSESNFLQNSNGSSFTLAGKIIEQGSGFEKAVFYFMRDGSDGKKRVYNPMEEHGSDNKNNRTDIAANSGALTTTEPIYINDDKLPVLPLTVTNNASAGTLTANAIMNNNNIRVGGLVYIGGLYRTITAINRTAGSVTINPAYDGSETNAYFVYGLVVDHTGEGENSDGSIRGDDGDGVLESFSGSQSKNYSWEASFNSANIPDGPIQIYVVAFDHAGNIGYGYTTTRASNNAPRITKVMLGTDLNGNGKYDFGSGEFSTFYADIDDNNIPITKTGRKAWTLNTKEKTGNSKSWKVKKGLAVIPEFVGGSGNFYYKFSKGTEVINDPQKISDTTDTLTETYLASYKLKDAGEEDLIKITGTNTNATWAYSTNKVNEVNVTNSGGSLTLDNSDIGSSNEDTDVYFRFTFWDSTEDSTPGFDTGSTILNLQVEQDITDNKEPKSVIKPFDWKGTGYTRAIYKSVNFAEDTLETADSIDKLGDNYSLGTTVKTEVADDGTVTITKTTITPNNNLYGASKENGHIELEKDLSANIKTLFGDTDDTKDPKVSGKITFSGTAYDDTRLSSIWFKFDSFTTVENEVETGLTRAQNSTTYDVAPNGVTGYTQAAWYDSAAAEWKVATPSANWEISVSDEYFDQKGHKAIWYLTIDTAQITNAAGKDKKLSIMTLDASGSKSETTADTTSTDDDVYNKPEYQVDVVPYISGINTDPMKKGLKDNNIRSASGKYSIIYAASNTAATYVADFITVSGFNLNPAAVRVVNTAGGTGTSIDQTAGVEVNVNTIDTTNYKSFTVNNIITKSGYLEVFVQNGSDYIRSLNNINNNDAYGSYTFTGSKVNGVVTASLTDRKNAYNREANYDVTKNVQLTDDRYITMWDMRDTGVENGYYPVMIMNGNNPVFGYVDNNGGPSSAVGTGAGTGAGTWASTNAHAQRAEFSGSEFSTDNKHAKEIYTEYLVKQLATEQMGMAVDAGGSYYNVTLFNYAGGGLGLYYDRYNELHSANNGDCWGPGTTYTDYTGHFAYDAENNAIIMETTSYNNSLKLNRYEYPKVLAQNNSVDGNASVYMCYFDSKTNEIIFRDFMIGSDITDTFSETPEYTFGYVGTVNNNYYFQGERGYWNGKYIKVNNNYYRLIYDDNYRMYRINNNPTYYNFTSSIYTRVGQTNNYNVYNFDGSLDSSYEQKVNFLENHKNSTTYSTGRHSVVTTGSKNFDMGVTSDNHVVIAYVDSVTNKLMLKYSTNAVDGSNPTANVAWTTSSVTFPDNVGSYVSLAVDGTAVHIAAFDSLDSNLVYMYLPNYNSAKDYKQVTVDQASAVGNWTQIKVKNGIPYIAYYNATETGGRDPIKIAYPVAANGKTAVQNKENPGVDVEPGTAYAAGGRDKGSATGYTTGAWEYMTVPAISVPQGGDPKFQNVCLGFDSSNNPVVGYLGSNLEFGKALGE